MVAWLAVSLVKPFRALRYDEERAGRLDDLVAPPHDVITPEMREQLLAASPYNAVRLIRPDDPDEAGHVLRSWQEQGVLVREREPAVWILEEEFTAPDGSRRTRRGLIARVRLEPYSSGRVLPHERTLARPKEARLPLLRATRTKLSPILLLHEGSVLDQPAGELELEATLTDTTSRLWRVTDPGRIEQALAQVRGRLFIADGHHRYETALRFHEEEGGEETAFVLAALVSRHDEGLQILPTHRIVAGPPLSIGGDVRATALSDGAAVAVARLADLPRGHPAFVLLTSEKAVLIESDPGPGALGILDTALVDEFLPVHDVRYTPDALEAERAVRSGEAGTAVLVRAPTIQQIEDITRLGERMPQKSTYFYPKLLSGLLFSPFDE
jgi:uncharacterized protein (DUF1015 family)